MGMVHEEINQIAKPLDGIGKVQQAQMCLQIDFKCQQTPIKFLNNSLSKFSIYSTLSMTGSHRKLCL